jgi:hypothetical protein
LESLVFKKNNNLLEKFKHQTLGAALISANIIDNPSGDLPNRAQAIEDLIIRLQNIVLGTAGIIAVAMIIWGAIILGTAGGNEEKIGKGKKILTYAVGGLIFILISGFLVGAFIRLLGGDIK